MSRIRGKDTAPELIVRKLLHRLGVRFRLHRRDLPGTPDIVMPARRKIVLVHGCFWHGHGCKIGQLPKSNEAFWQQKLDRNRANDRVNERAVRMLGWQVLTVWQCQARDLVRLERDLRDFVSESPKNSIDI